MTSLDVGCGANKHRGCIGVDLRKLKGVDVVADVRRLPFKDNVFEVVILRHIVEHINDLISFMEDVWRICKNHAIIRVWTPHFTAQPSYTDPTHVRHLTFQSFDYFDKTTGVGKVYWFTKDVEFRIKRRRIIFSLTRSVFWNYVVEKIANLYPLIYEGSFGWIFPAKEIYFELEVVKKEEPNSYIRELSEEYVSL